MEGPSFLNILISWLPILVLIGVWIIFMRKFRTTADPNVEMLEEMRTQTEILTRIAATVEQTSPWKSK